MGSKGQFAQHQALAADVRFGSKADIGRRLLMSAFPPKADIAYRVSDVR
jgi:hypothetical protein